MSTRKVVIIEDEQILRDALAAKFQNEGFSVKTAEDGAQGLKLILTEQPDAVLLDLFLPALSGLEILGELEHDPSFDDEKTKILILTNFSGKEHEGLIEDMTVAYLIKSEHPLQNIVEKVKEVLE